MKNLLLATFIIVATCLSAQEQYKPEAGDVNLQVNFAPLGGSPISIFGVTGRSFSTESSAIRATVFLGFENQSTVTQDEDSDFDFEELVDKNRSFSFSIAPGIENHFAGTERLSPYYGGFVNLGFTSTSESEQQQFGEDVITTTTKGGSLDFGLNGVTGFDYYVAQNLYMGVEMGFGLAVSSPFASKSESDADGAEEVESKVGNTSSFQVGPNVFGQFRLGWILK